MATEKQKSYLFTMSEDIFFKIRNRATLESQVSGSVVSFKDILDRAIEKEVKGFKPLVKKQ